MPQVGADDRQRHAVVDPLRQGRLEDRHAADARQAQARGAARRRPAQYGKGALRLDHCQRRALKTILLFDIDGTLVLSGGAGGRAMSRAFEDLYGVRDAFNGVPFNGCTDAWITTQAAARHGIDPAELSRFKPLYLQYLADELQRPVSTQRKGIMPGVRELLDVLAQRDDVFLALLTGNFVEGARLKLEYFDLWRYFACGAFGDTVRERNDLLAEALAKVTACSGLNAH